MGFPQIGYQAFKLLAYQRLHEMARQWEQRYPGVDIVLIEPEPNDELMFQTSIMNFTKRVEIARHGFESVTLALASDYDHFREVCERHGIQISATRVRKVVKHFAAASKERETAPGARSSSRRRARCCASRPATSQHGRMRLRLVLVRRIFRGLRIAGVEGRNGHRIRLRGGPAVPDVTASIAPADVRLWVSAGCP